MLTKTFAGGVSLTEYKDLTVDKKIKIVPAPAELVVPLSQHMGAPNEPIVKEGDYVRMGERIGGAKAFISAPVHSPVSGKVKAIKNFFNPIYGKRPAVVIENDGKDELFPQEEMSGPESFSRERLAEIVKNAGVVGLGGAAFPTHVKLSIPKEKHVDTLIVNGAECEPYLTCDHRLMLEKADEILMGVGLIARILEMKSVFFAIEENKLSAVFVIEKTAREMEKRFPDIHIQVVILRTKYPQGGEKQLIKSILRREVPPGKLPLDVGVIVQNAGTCLAVYQAAYEGKPLIERCVTLTGSCLKKPGNFVVRIGTPVKALVEFCGGLSETPAKIIVGGPMMGVAQHTLDAPVMKGVTGVIFLSSADAKLFEENACVRCAKCVDICPVNLVPTEIMRMVKYSRWHYMEELHSTDCVECGSCAYICPSRIPLVQYIKLAKDEALKRKR